MRVTGQDADAPGDAPMQGVDGVDYGHDAPVPSGSTFSRVVFVGGAAGLLLATATDAIAVLGRHSGFALLGSIEIVQLAVVLAASSAMVGATLQHAHASVNIFTERMAPATAKRLARMTALVSALLFLVIAAGSVWVAADLWSGHERTEILQIPLHPARMFWIAAALTIAFLFARQAVSARPQ